MTRISLIITLGLGLGVTYGFSSTFDLSGGEGHNQDSTQGVPSIWGIIAWVIILILTIRILWGLRNKNKNN